MTGFIESSNPTPIFSTIRLPSIIFIY